jgi:preprotein translocase subunit SecE
MSTEETLENGTTDEESSEEGLESTDLAASSDAPLEGEEGEGAGKKTLGVERWVQLCYVVVALTLIWLFDHIINGIWYLFADPNEGIVTAAAVVVGIVGTIVLYGNKPVYSLIHDVTDEMSRVSWPTRKETSQSTIVVVVTSIVAALMLFLFDSVWSAVTDLVYKV